MNLDKMCAPRRIRNFQAACSDERRIELELSEKAPRRNLIRALRREKKEDLGL